MPDAVWLLGFISLQRLAEVFWSAYTTARLRAAGGVEFGAAHYPLIVAEHVLWIGGLWALGYDHSVNRYFVAVVVALQLVRFWVMWTLGRRWTTRVIVVPGETFVAAGPYRLMRHPNYAVVILEMAAVPLALGLPVFAGVFFVATTAILWLRMRTEDTAMAWAAGGGALPMANGGDSYAPPHKAPHP